MPAVLKLPLVLLAILLTSATTALAQTGQAPGIPSYSLSNQVPATTAIFVELCDLKANRKNLAQADLWRAVELLAGDVVEKNRANLDWRGLIRGVLEMDPDDAIKELFSQRVALAATGWSELANAVVLTRIRSHSMLDKLNAPGRVKHSEIRGRSRVVELQNGLWIATDGQIAAFCRLGGPGTQFNAIADILANQPARKLANSSEYIRWVTSLSRGYAGYVYVSPAGRNPAATSGESQKPQGSPAKPIPGPGGAVGMYFRADRLDFEVWAGRSPAAVDPDKQPTVDFDRLAHLPDSTIMVWARSGDIQSGYREIFSGPMLGPSAPFLTLIRDVFDLEVVEQEIISQLGPRMMIVWDHSHSGSNLPELAALLESSDAEHTARSMAAGLADVAGALSHAEGEDQQKPALDQTEELGTRIYTVSFSGADAPGSKKPRAWNALSMLRLSFADLDGWVIAAASPEHARRIIRAYHGVDSRLQSVAAVDLDKWRLASEATELVIAHPAFAAAEIASWQRNDVPNKPSLFSFIVPDAAPQIQPIHNRSLGIGVRTDPRGGVEIARVHAREPAVGRLHVGDRIIGVDGGLLSLENPKDDLRRKIAESTDPAKLTLRIWRGDELLDVVVPIPHAIPIKAPSPDETTSLLRNIQILSRRITYAAYAVTRSAPDVFHAHLSLRLATR